MATKQGIQSLSGLTDEEISKSREIHGENTFSKKKKKGFLRSFFGNFGDPMLRILLIALGIQVVFVFNSGQWLETFGIAMAIFVAVTVSTLSEYGSEKAFEKLAKQAALIECRVRRNGQTQTLPVSEVVVGDLVLLGSGDKIPADGVMVDGEIEVDQSLLNGESKEAKKLYCGSMLDKNTTSSGIMSDSDKNEAVDYLNMGSVFSGTVVTSGQGIMQVYSVGNKTEYGKIAAELQEDVPTSPLKVKLQGLAKLISVIGYIGAGLVAFAYFFNLLFISTGFNMADTQILLTDWNFMIEHILRAATLVVAVIVMAVPEGLPMMITVVLSSNMKHMLRDNVLVRKMGGIETAGSMNILFTDKTGTLTNGKLDVVGVLSGEGEFLEVSKISKKSHLVKLLGTALRFNTGTELSSQGKALGGNSTDRILTEFAGTLTYEKGVKKTTQIPFDSKNKFMSTTLADGRVLFKGAAEVLLPKVKKCYTKDGQIVSISHRQLQNMVVSLSNQAYRLICVLINDVLVGLVAIRDQVRPESVIAIKRLAAAGIQTVMITGDAKETATAVAREVGILKCGGENNLPSVQSPSGVRESGIVLTSIELNALSDDDLCSILPDIRVIARALPSDKSRLVRIAQSLGLVAGMTGDGVNDAPALKKADIGFAMGSGTEVAKEAGDIIILDDNIDSISKAVSYGRTIFKSIRKFLIFKLTINFCAMAVSIIAPLLKVDTPITVIQMLWINLIMDTLAGLAFGGERPQENYMKEPPKRRNEKIVNRYMWTQIIIGSIFTAAISLWFLTSDYMQNLSSVRGGAYAMTTFFAFFMMMNIFNSFNARSHDLNILSHIRKNRPFIVIMGVVAVVQVIMLYVGGSIFRTVPLDFAHLGLILLLALTVFPVDLTRKLFIKTKTTT